MDGQMDTRSPELHKKYTEFSKTFLRRYFTFQGQFYKHG